MIVIEKTKHSEICSLAICNLIVLAVRIIGVCIAIFRNLYAWLKALLVDPEAALQGHGCTVQPCAIPASVEMLKCSLGLLLPELKYRTVPLPA